ncbi:hypothetical protein QFZ54_000284 [Sphingomonas faeni]|nr:hypothetical protein [Sphingomonas faeni]
MKPGPVGEVVGIAAFAKRIEAAVDAFKPDILHAHSPVIAALAALIVRKRKLPLVYEVRAFWEDAAVGNGTGTATSMRYRVRRSSAITGWSTSSPIRANACV